MQVLELLIAGLRRACGGFTDVRRGQNVTYGMEDVGMAAFSLFFMQSESFLAHQRHLEQHRHRSNCQTLFGIEKIPTDNHIRKLLDMVDPVALQPCFDEVLAALRTQAGLAAFERLSGRTLIALDGTEYFCSQKLGCDQCLHRKRSSGVTEHYHSMLCATVVAPGHSMALPLMPEFITPQDGHEKQDCEREAAKRWLSAHAQRMQPLKPIYLGDDLFACQPLAEAILAQGADFLFTCKPDSHKTLYDFMHGAEFETHSMMERKGGKRLTYRYRWMNQVPIRDGKNALHVQWIGVEITNGKGKITYKNGFCTSLAVTADNVAEIVACGRARWKIENESFNVLKNNGYHLEHNFGHGTKYLAMMFAVMNLLAFAFHTICDCACALWDAARHAKGSRRRFFEHLRTITAYIVFNSWNELLKTLLTSTPPTKMAQNA
jgi:hypothetical protein